MTERKIVGLTFTLVVLFCLATSPVTSFANEKLSKIREIESKVQKVVASNMETCVSITDGMSFGSGVVVSAEGLVLTAGHVLSSRSNKYEVIFPSGRRLQAKMIGKNLNVDAGMLQILDVKNLKFAELAEKLPQEGDWTVSLGHSGGFELGRKPPVRTGKYIHPRGYQLVTDAVLIGGDSGGPLFNLDGKLIGIHSSIGGSIAENRHVRIDIFKKYWTRLESGETWGKLPELAKPERIVQRPKIGITVDTKLNNGKVLEVKPGSPANDVGIVPNDIVIEFDGVRLKSSTHLIELIKQKSIGEVCPIKVIRNNRTIQFDIHMRASND